jgi:hypothetical protein
MADLDVRRDTTATPEDDYTTGELIFWILGILSIPLVPILMVLFLTPYSGF